MHPDINAIQQASQGLLMMSESDYPFQTFHWIDAPASIENKLLQETGHDANTLIETTTLDHFFRNMTSAGDRADARQQETAARFTLLKNTLLQKLSGIVVYRIGTIQVDAFILGKLADGSYAGLRTRLVET